MARTRTGRAEAPRKMGGRSALGYDSAAIVHKGIEKPASKEISMITGAACSQAESAVFFNASDEMLCRLAVRAGTVKRVMRLACTAEVNSHLEESLASIKAALCEKSQLDLKGLLKGKSFRASCERSGGHDYGSEDIAPAAGEMLLEIGGEENTRVRLEKPDITMLFCIIGTRCYIGIDFSGLDLSKRRYRVFPTTSPLNASIARALLVHAGFGARGRTVLLDPFCGCGTIAIEAALLISNRAVHIDNIGNLALARFLDAKTLDSIRKEFGPDAAPPDSRKGADNLERAADEGPFKPGRKEETGGAAQIIATDSVQNHIRAARNNMMLAGAENLVRISRIELDWLDTRLEKGSADLIVSRPPVASRRRSDIEIQKVYREMFHQAGYVLKESGRVILCAPGLQVSEGTCEGWKAVSHFSAWQGKEELKVVEFSRR